MFHRGTCVLVFFFLVHKISSPMLSGKVVIWINIFFNLFCKKNTFECLGLVLLNLTLPVYEFGHLFCKEQDSKRS